MEKILLQISTPIFAILILTEMLVGHFSNKRIYTKGDTAINLLCTSLNFINDLLFRGITLFLLTWFNQFAIFHWEYGLIYWILLFLAQDFAYYVLHYADHYIRFFWATHVTHHSSKNFNFTVAIRSSVFQPFYRWLFYIPLALMGFDALHILFMYAACQVYGFWVHTEMIDKLPSWIEFVFVTPSHHRVHHASNIRYLDSNMGMVLIIWDRIFGTFVEEDKNLPIKYGLTKPISETDAKEIIFGEWKSLWADIRRAKDWPTRLRFLIMPPGWSPDASSLTSAELKAAEANALHVSPLETATLEQPIN